VSFAVWAPNAKGVSLIGEFNGWDGNDAPMRVLGSSGVWELFWPGFAADGLYKFRVHGIDDVITDRADPMAFATEKPPCVQWTVFHSTSTQVKLWDWSVNPDVEKRPQPDLCWD
jgi:1,4-alpha-glucan branching enzyme